jgi:hypothetical protein
MASASRAAAGPQGSFPPGLSFCTSQSSDDKRIPHDQPLETLRLAVTANLLVAWSKSRPGWRALLEPQQGRKVHFLRGLAFAQVSRLP